MHVRTRDLVRVALVLSLAVLALGAGSAKAWNSDYVFQGGNFGTTSCPQMSGPMFQQSGEFCFYFPNGSADTPALCDPTFCGSLKFRLVTPGTFTASLTYPSPNGFNILGLQLCQDNQAAPDPATCSQTMSPGGAPVDCVTDITPGDNGTPDDLTDDTMTTTITCPISALDTTNPYTLIVYPITVMNCADVMDATCAADFTQGVTAALSGNFTGTMVSPAPDGGKMEGGGEVGSQQHFALHAVNSTSKWNQTHIRYAISGNSPMKCEFYADSASLVDIEPSPLGRDSGGTARVSGTGTVVDALHVKHQNVPYQLQVNDGGKGGTDTFQLSAPGCDTNGLPVPVTHGQIHIDQDHHSDHH